MERGLQDEPVGYGILMPASPLTQLAASIGTSLMPLTMTMTMIIFYLTIIYNLK